VAEHSSTSVSNYQGD